MLDSLLKKTVYARKRKFECFVQSIAFCSRSIKSSNPSNVKSVEKTSAVSPFSNNIRERDTKPSSLTNATSAVGRMKITFYFKVISKNIQRKKSTLNQLSVNSAKVSFDSAKITSNTWYVFQPLCEDITRRLDHFFLKSVPSASFN